MGKIRAGLVSGVSVLLLFVTLFGAALKVPVVRASGTIYIRADGSIDPPTAPISTVDNITYTFTGDINDSIVVERDNLIVDGSGYTVQGTGVLYSNGINLIGRSGVTVKNTTIQAFYYGIRLEDSSNNSIVGNNPTDNYFGIVIHYYSYYNSIFGNNITSNNYGIGLSYYSYYNSISGNNITTNEYGITLSTSSNYNNISGNKITTNSGAGILLSSSSNYDSVSGNDITNSSYGIYLQFSSSNNTISSNNITANNNGGIWLDSSSNNTVSSNSITNNEYGIYIRFSDSSNTKIYHNNFVNNNIQVFSEPGSANAWDDGYPSGGNFWSDYTGVDLFTGPFQNDTGSDGIGDTAYVIGTSNQDNYPLMRPWVPFENQTIYIRADGSIDPSGAPIQRKGDLYTLTSNVTSYTDGIVVERDNVILDGAEYTLQGTGNGTGLNLTGRSNVTITNMKIKAFDLGIWLAASSTNTIARNILAENHNGIGLDYTSNNNTILGNNVTGTDDGGILVAGNENVVTDNLVSNCVGVYGWGINVYVANNNTIMSNKVLNNTCGLRLYHSRNNIIRNNEIADNLYGIYLEEDSCNNTIHHNYFINNTNQAHVESLTNVWDYGYPSGGNFWSDYNGTDLYSGPYQNETGNDGIGDAQYIINGNNQDRYPLMNPYWNPADINHDLKVDVKDVYLCAKAFGSLHGGLKWNPVYDMNDDGRIDLKDIWLICRNFGKTCP